MKKFSRCFVDESIYDDLGIVVTAFIFAGEDIEKAVRQEITDAGLTPEVDEFKSSARMDENPEMRRLRDRLMQLAGRSTSIAVFFGPFSRPRLGRQALQALQSVVIRNEIDTDSLIVHFDEGIFPSDEEAARLHKLFHHLEKCDMRAVEDSRLCFGIQVADSIAHCFGQIIKAALTGDDKTIDIGGSGTGYPEGTEASLGWALLMQLRYSLLTRPVVTNGGPYSPESDPVVLDPLHDDVVDFGQHPTLLGWGVQISPDSSLELRQAVEQALGRIWLGCIH